MERSDAGRSEAERERAERLAKDWITRLVDRTSLAKLGDLPLERLGAEAPALIATALETLADPSRGPGELATAGQALADLFGERTNPATSSASPPGVPGAAAGAHVAPSDPTTGLPGPDALADFLGLLLAEQRRYGHQFSLALIDIDGLGRVNDGYGRAAGDRMLAAVAAVLRRQLRDVDRAFRVEDDEFAVVAPHTDADRLASLAMRIANLIAGSQGAEGPRLAIAAGVVGCPGDGLGAERLLESATEAIYAAKASGAAVARSPSSVLQDP